MSHSLIGADRRIHVKIVSLAAAGATVMVLLGIAAERPEPVGRNIRSEMLTVKAGKPVLAASADGATIR